MRKNTLLFVFVCASLVMYACNERSSAMHNKRAEIGSIKNNLELPLDIESSRIQFKAGANCVARDKKGLLWIGNIADGLLSYDGSKYKSIVNSMGLIGKDIQSIISDNNGNLWISSEKGVCFYNGLVLLNFSDRTDIKNKGAFCGFKDSKGNLWFGAYKGYFKFDQQGFRYVELENVLKNKMDREYSVSSISEDREGNIWLGTQGAGVCKFDGEKYEYHTDAMLDQSAVRGIAQDSKGIIWIGSTKAGLLKYDGSKFEKVTTSNTSAPLEITALQKDADGEVLIGTMNHGLWKSKSEGIEVIDTTQKNIRSIYVEDSNKVWVCLMPEGC